jgi:hypothetical protein
MADDKIAEASAQSLAETLSIRIDGQRSGSGDAGGDDGGNSVHVEAGAQQELSAERVGEVFAVDAGQRKKLIVNLGEFGQKHERNRHSVTPALARYLSFPWIRRSDFGGRSTP